MDRGRGERIRTSDLLNPIQTRYQAALRPGMLYLRYDTTRQLRAPGRNAVAWLCGYASRYSGRVVGMVEPHGVVARLTGVLMVALPLGTP